VGESIVDEKKALKKKREFGGGSVPIKPRRTTYGKKDYHCHSPLPDKRKPARKGEEHSTTRF